VTHTWPVEVQQSTGPRGGATVGLTAVELRALFNILSFAASGGVITEKPEREMAARLATQLESALGDLQRTRALRRYAASWCCDDRLNLP
jgi:hypothetical protein